MTAHSLSPILAGKKACMFDLFHTLTSVEETSPGGPLTFEILGVPRERWLEQLMEKFPERLKGAEKDPVTIIARMARAINPGISDELIRKATEHRMRNFSRSLIKMPEDSIRTLAALKNSGLKIGLLSNADFMERAAWDESPAAHLFDSTVFSCDVGLMKPEREIYELSMRRLGEYAGNCIFIGDGGSDELRGAREAGITTVMVRGLVGALWPEVLAERIKYADFIIDRVSDLLE
jgi:putative hydrolase of the HAD superfamily